MHANFKDPLCPYGDLIEADVFVEHVLSHFFIDYDGFGHPVQDDKMDGEIIIQPSLVFSTEDLPEGTTHILWFNK